MLGCDAHREAAEEGVRDEGRRRLAGGAHQAPNQLANISGIQLRRWVGFTEAGQIRHDDAVLPSEPGDHRRPVDPAAFDPAVQQDQRWSCTGFEDRGRDARQSLAALFEARPLQQSSAFGTGLRAHEANVFAIRSPRIG